MKASCGGLIGLIIFNLSLGAWCFDYVLHTIWGLDVPWWKDMLCGLLLGQFTAPAAIICWVATWCGATPPFVG